MPARRIPVEITTVRTPDGKEQRVPRVPLDDVLMARNVDVQKATEDVAARYWKTLAQGREILKQIEQGRRASRRVDPRLYWELGDLLVRFIRNNDKGEVFLDRLKAHFCKDLGISDPSWRKIIRFRSLVPSAGLLDHSKDWRFYRDAPSRRIREAIAARAARAGGSETTAEISLRLPRSAALALGDLARRVSAKGAPSVDASCLVAALLELIAVRAAGSSPRFSSGDLISELAARLANSERQEDDSGSTPSGK